ncbi:GspE/PulE family protein [Tamlana sp. 2_MG-2023]|uniref:GspE/PulE family protein n=1 Tax=unclassified Tamlana TaxID=2614803 RepID=UPI0026E356F4|nr:MULTISPECIES: GspE/PulE family protein [unclassified Tamlana]MDO6758571.1 GspE/PulE family protein [Tamlana sp. 2_MG-2023]MDO6789270.1 GspE/PulE family protein [Tamlana sp. 1_MG-2023]
MKITKDIQVSVELQQLINTDLAHHYSVVPKEKIDGVLTLYADEKKWTPNVKEELELYLGISIIFEKISTERLNKALFLYYRKNSEQSTVSSNFSGQNNFLEDLIFEAKSIGSSDIHFEVYEDEARARLRIDGVLVEKYKVPKEHYLELVNKIKIESNLDITEKRLPQDGRINYENFDLRVSILPTLHGEKVVMRILGKDASEIDLEDLGFEKEEKEIYLEAVKKSNGIVLISGPTGSGKTTTLYATLKLLNNIKRNIVTVEDPIEYTLKGINQVQLKEDIGLTFGAALRSFLRQDPDIIMLGEIRDSETAKMAIRASLTGHLVLSTIHTNSALGTISRLIDMGVPAFYIAETLNVSVAQRLVRRLCNHCKKEVRFDENELPKSYEMLKLLNTHFVANGCQECYYTGYRGRRAIYEIVPVTDEVVKGIKKDNHQLKQCLGITYVSLADKAFNLLEQGETSLEEIYSLLINS